MESMTGYANIEGKTPLFSFHLEIKSLNSKYNEYYINLPRSLKSEETILQSLVSDEIRRGKVELNFEITEWHDERSYAINKPLFMSFYRDMMEIERETKGKTFTLDSILAMEGVMNKSRTVIDQKTRDEIAKAVSLALKKLRTMRKNEGKALEKDILASLLIISDELTQVKKSVKTLYEKNFAKFRERIAALAGQNVDEQRLLTEAAIMADRIDVNEELVRLSDHIAKFKETVKAADCSGKKLDFIAQEMFREINTIGSKSVDSSVSHRVVNMKNAIDKIREQCRNIV